MVNSTYCTAITILILAGLLARPCNADPLAITPFYSFNQSPLVQIYGLPAAESSIIQPMDHTWGLLALDVASHFVTNESRQESFVLDGESERITLALRHGLTRRLEIGMDLPLIGYNGGVFDDFIKGFHRTFGYSQYGRDKVPDDRLLFAYSKNGEEQLRLDDSNFGLGDLRLTCGWQIYNRGSANPLAVALRASLKLPTGSSTNLRGSGSTDIALWFTGSDDYLLPGSWGHVTVFSAIGGMAMTDGQVLKDQRQNLAGFGTLGFGWSPADFFALKAQFSAHSGFYRGSETKELSDVAMLLLVGGTYAISPRTALDIALSENINVTTSPDVALHLGLSRQF